MRAEAAPGTGSGGRSRVLPELPPELARRGRRVRRPVVVELHVHHVGLLGEAACAAGDLLELLARVLPSEPLGHAAPGQVALGVAPVGAQVGELRVRHGVDGRHDRQVVARGRVDAYERRAVLREEVERLVRALAVDPAAVAKLDRDEPRRERFQQSAQLVELVVLRRERRRELQQEGAELPGLLERCDRGEGLLDHRLLELGSQHDAAAARRPRAVAQRRAAANRAAPRGARAGGGACSRRRSRRASARPSGGRSAPRGSRRSSSSPRRPRTAPRTRRAGRAQAARAGTSPR